MPRLTDAVGGDIPWAPHPRSRRGALERTGGQPRPRQPRPIPEGADSSAACSAGESAASPSPPPESGSEPAATKAAAAAPIFPAGRRRPAPPPPRQFSPHRHRHEEPDARTGPARPSGHMERRARRARRASGPRRRIGGDASQHVRTMHTHGRNPPTSPRPRSLRGSESRRSQAPPGHNPRRTVKRYGHGEMDVCLKPAVSVKIA